MNIVIPKSGLPQAAQRLSNDVSEFGDVIKTFEDQKNLIAAQRIENDLRVHLDKFDANVLQNTDGTEEGLFDKIRSGHDEIKNTYAKQAPNFAVARYLDRAYVADQQGRMRNVQKVLDDKLFKTSYEAVQIKVDDEIRGALQTGEFGTGLQNIDEYMTAQSAFFGADTQKIHTEARGRYAAQYLKTGLVNPQTAPLIVQRLSDPQQKQMFFSMLPVDDIDEMEMLLTHATKTTAQNSVYSELYQKHSLGSGRANYAGAIREIRDPNKYKALDTDQRRELENMLKAQQGYDEYLRNDYKAKLKDKDMEQVYALVNGGHLTHALNFIQESSSFTEAEKFKIKNSIASSHQTQQTDVATYLEGVDIVYDPEKSPTEKKLWIMANANRMSRTDWQHFFNVAKSDEKKTTLSAVRDGIKILKSTLVMSGMNGPTADARLKRAVAIYEKGLQENKDELKTPEAKRDYAYQILKMPEFLNVNHVADMKADMKRMRGVGVSPSAPGGTSPAMPSGTIKIFDNLPSASEFKDKIIKDTATGTRWKSDGKNWIEVK